jgi:hypothetical protein
MAAKRGAGDDMTVAHVALKDFPDSSQFMVLTVLRLCRARIGTIAAPSGPA